MKRRKAYSLRGDQKKETKEKKESASSVGGRKVGTEKIHVETHGKKGKQTFTLR